MPAQVPEKARQIMPSKRTGYPRNWHEADCMGARVIDNNTHLARVGDSWAVVLHGTAVVTFDPDGAVTLDTGGWQTPTTRSRMEACGFPVCTRKHKPFLYLGGDTYIPYRDGMRRIGGVWEGEPTA